MLPQESVFMTHKHKVRISFYVRLLLSLINMHRSNSQLQSFTPLPTIHISLQVIPLKRMFYIEFQAGARILEKCIKKIKQGRSQYEANRGTRLGKILPDTVDFYFFYQTDNIGRFHTADFVQRTVCSPRL